MVSLDSGCMTARQTITASVAFAAVAMAWISQQWRNAANREAHIEQKCMQDALDTFEGEGGLVLS